METVVVCKDKYEIEKNVNILLEKNGWKVKDFQVHGAAKSGEYTKDPIFTYVFVLEKINEVR